MNINGKQGEIRTNGEEMELIVGSRFGQIRFELNENWQDLFLDAEGDDEEEEDVAMFFLEALRDTQPGDAHRRFADAPDDNSFCVTSPRTEAEIAEARSNAVYRDLVISIGQGPADQLCRELF
jgi:hypothetical protein